MQSADSPLSSTSLDIRLVGDPVLTASATEVTEIDDRLIQLSKVMYEAMLRAQGIGLAAPQIGVSKRFFVYDLGEGLKSIINPEIKETSGEWVYEEGCLSVPGYSWEITRPKEILINGMDMDGNEVEVEADELFSRLIQHEVDHLNGVLLLERLDPDERKKALREIRKIAYGTNS